MKTNRVAVPCLVLSIVALAGPVLLAQESRPSPVAIKTGDMSEHGIEMTRPQHDAVHEHEELADRTRVVFTALTLAFAALVAAGRRSKSTLLPMAHGIFLVAYLLGLVVLANTAHHGGLVVHGYGVRAPVAGMPDAAALPPDAGGSTSHDDDD